MNTLGDALDPPITSLTSSCTLRSPRHPVPAAPWPWLVPKLAEVFQPFRPLCWPGSPEAWLSDLPQVCQNSPFSVSPSLDTRPSPCLPRRPVFQWSA